MNGKSVVITGASSGIGRASALLLARDGFQVFAGVRKSQDRENLRHEGGDGVIPVILDVTDPTAIKNSAAEVASRLNGDGLTGLINVAGIGMSGPLQYVTPEDLRRMFEVDVFGQLAVTQAFLPMLYSSQGRIVNISSVGAHIAIPFGGVLSACKSAFGSLSDALRLELAPFGIRVCTIEPGAIHTPAVDKTLGDVEGVIRRLPPEGATRYAQTLRIFTQRAYAREMKGSSPEVVAAAVRDAVTSRHPKIRYVVGKDAKQLAILPRLLPDRWLDALRVRMLGLPPPAGNR